MLFEKLDSRTDGKLNDRRQLRKVNDNPFALPSIDELPAVDDVVPAKKAFSLPSIDELPSLDND